MNVRLLGVLVLLSLLFSNLPSQLQLLQLVDRLLLFLLRLVQMLKSHLQGISFFHEIQGLPDRSNRQLAVVSEDSEEIWIERHFVPVVLMLAINSKSRSAEIKVKLVDSSCREECGLLSVEV